MPRIFGFVGPVADGNTSGDACGAVTGYEIVRATGTTEPGRDPANWTVGQTIPSDGSAASFQVTVDCSNPTVDAFIATRLLFPDGQKPTSGSSWTSTGSFRCRRTSETPA
jgi:hypothetical protein